MQPSNAKKCIQLVNNTVQINRFQGLKNTAHTVKEITIHSMNAEINGKVKLQLQSENLTIEQEFTIANIQGIVGILGMDFLIANDGDVNVKKQS